MGTELPSIRLVATLFQESIVDLNDKPCGNISKEQNNRTMVVNKENTSADLNMGVNSVKSGSVDNKDLLPMAGDSNSNEARAFSPRPNNLSGFTVVNKGNQSPPLPNRINLSTLPVLHSVSKAPSSSTSTMSSPVSSICSPNFGSKTPPGPCLPLSASMETRNSAFSVASSVVLGVGGGLKNEPHLLSQHLLELNQMRPHQSLQSSSPPYKFFQDNAFYQARPLMNGNDLSEFKKNVKEKQVERESFATTSEATSEKVVVDGNDDGTDESQQNTVSS